VLAQVDAAIGGKTGVNLVSGKNLLGTFHQRARAGRPRRSGDAAFARILRRPVRVAEVRSSEIRDCSGCLKTAARDSGSQSGGGWKVIADSVRLKRRW